jgi:hypothetical protein
LEDETIADDLDVGAVAQHLAQLAEEFRAVGSELFVDGPMPAASRQRIRDSLARSAA